MSVSNAVDISMTSVEVGIQAGVQLDKSILKGSERPANIGVGTYNKYVAKEIKKLDFVANATDKFFKFEAIAEVGLDVGTGIYEDYNNGESNGKILWDATVNLAVSGVNTYLSIEAGAAIGTLVCPGLGTLGGVIGSIIVGGVLSIVSDRPRRYMKSWY